MGVFETFSKREKRRERSGEPDVYVYDQLPNPLRIQVIHIWMSTIGLYSVPDSFDAPEPPSNKMWHQIHDTLIREMSVFRLGKKSQDGDPFQQCQEFLQVASPENALDLIDVSFAVINTSVRELAPDMDGRTQDPDSAIEELNYRFREHGVGYQFVGGRLIKVNSEYVHSEVVRGALALLQDQKFRGPEDEFMRAHEHYRHGRNKEAIVEALKAFESTMKAICDLRKWAYPQGATAKALLDALFSQGLIPTSLQSQFSALRSVLESGVPTIRNTSGGHGQGTSPVDVPDHVAAYALHLAASNIVFLVEANNKA